MATNTLTPLSDDLARGEVVRVTALRVLDGIPGWTEVVMADGQRWAYAPHWYCLLYGEIARQLS